MKQKRGLMALIIILAIVLVDQIIKVYVKTHFYLHEEIEVTSWFRLLFVENNGMAFGMELFSKLILTLGRICAVIFLFWYIARIHMSQAIRTGYIILVAMITAGALGNIIDCMFYGLIFDDPAWPAVATFMPEGGGYAPMFYGKVVDMFYFPLFSFDWPEWMPFVGGERFVFFRPVFNFADAAISCGITGVLLFYSKQISAGGFIFDKNKSKNSGDAA